MKGFTLVGSILGMTEALSGIKGLVRELILYTAILVLQCTFNSFLSWSTQLMASQLKRDLQIRWVMIHARYSLA